MNSFLHRIADAFYAEYQSDIRKFTFVFPNRRAGLFFQKYLSERIERPIFSPEISTITDCFCAASTRQVVDRTAALFRLYRLYKTIGKTDEGFDAFVFWGEMLLADFNEVDAFCVDAKSLFFNIKNLNEINSLAEYLTPPQQQAIQEFWHRFLVENPGATREEFIAIWRILFPLYEQFRNELQAENLATEGMILRSVAEQLDAGEGAEYFAGKQFVFIGFNALNTSEKRLFKALQKRGQADFYWDYEGAELQDTDNPASAFFAENSRDFPSKLSIAPSTIPLAERACELIAIPSSVGQAKTVHRLLTALYPAQASADEWIKTAVVLPDEHLLVPLLHSLPQQIENINVTMGFPLKATPAAGLLENIFDLQRRANASGHFYHLSVLNVLKHPYISLLCENDAAQISRQMAETNAIYVEPAWFAENQLLATIFSRRQAPKAFVAYLLEVLEMLNIAWQQRAVADGEQPLTADFLYQYYTAVNRMNEVMKSVGGFEMSLDTLIRLIRQLVGGIAIPFEGEPLNGLQLMGVLETRGLDFENLIICSFNEGVFPKKTYTGSFIPQNLRRAFQLPTADQNDAVSAYNFYRLIQRGKRLFFLYDSRTEGMQTGEASRFVYQLTYHYGAKMRRTDMAYDVKILPQPPIEVKKTPDVLAKLKPFLTSGADSRSLSASSINTYIGCPLRFYFSYVENIREPDEVQERIEAGMFGTLLHGVMENLYEPFVGQLVSEATLNELRKDNRLIDKTIAHTFAVEFFKKDKNTAIQLEGKYLLTARVIKKFVEQILKKDAEQAPFRYVRSEEKIIDRLPIRGGAEGVNVKGIIDRVDEKEGRVRILDYKTGSDELKFNTVDELFEKNKNKRPKAVLQTFFYSLLYQQKHNAGALVPEVLKVRDVFNSSFTTRLYDGKRKQWVDNFEEYRAEFTDRLTREIEEIFDPDIPFAQCTEVELCKWCDFKSLCRTAVDNE